MITWFEELANFFAELLRSRVRFPHVLNGCTLPCIFSLEFASEYRTEIACREFLRHSVESHHLLSCCFSLNFKAVMLLAVNVNSLQFEDKSIRHIHITFINYNKWIVMYTKRFATVHVKLPSTPLHGKKLVWGRQPWPLKLFSLEVPVALSLDQPRATRIWYVSWMQG